MKALFKVPKRHSHTSLNIPCIISIIEKFFIVFLLLSPYYSHAQVWAKYLEADQELAADLLRIKTTKDENLLHVKLMTEGRFVQSRLARMTDEGSTYWLSEPLPYEFLQASFKFFSHRRVRYGLMHSSRDSRNNHGIVGMRIYDENGSLQKLWRYRDELSMRFRNIFTTPNELFVEVELLEDGIDTIPERVQIITNLDGKEIGYKNIEIPDKYNVENYYRIKSGSINEMYIPIISEDGLKLVKLRKLKKEIWKLDCYPKEEKCRFIKVIEKGSDKYVITKFDWSLYITKYNSEHQKEWTTELENAYTIRGCQLLPNGDLVIGTMDVPRRSGKKSRLTKLDKDGKLIWQSILAKEFEDQFRGFSINKDGSYLTVINTSDLRDDRNKVLLIKVGPNGETPTLDGAYEAIKIK